MAEVALAVDDAFHGKGLGSLLLERLALLAVQPWDHALLGRDPWGQPPDAGGLPSLWLSGA